MERSGFPETPIFVSGMERSGFPETPILLGFGKSYLIPETTNFDIGEGIEKCRVDKAIAYPPYKLLIL